MSLTKKRIIGGAVALLAALLIVVMNPFKVTDPASLYFQPENFMFSDYRGDPKDEELRAALKRTFPIGTSKEFVDKVMAENNVESIGVTFDGKIVQYYVQPFLRSQHQFVFDKKGALTNIHPYAGKRLYEESPDRSSVRGY